MNRKVVLFCTTVALTLILVNATEVSAFQFELYYFETDQINYNIGEPIEMISKILADFSTTGWCYISFSVVAESGTIYLDERMIPPSPDIRYLTSTYYLQPTDLSPGENGTQIYAIFNAEMFDGYSETVTETIELNISRGQLDCNLLSSFVLEENTNSTISVELVSRHNQSIPYTNSDLLLEVADLNSTPIITRSLVTNDSGIASTTVSQDALSSGNYTLQVLTNSTESWDPTTKEFNLEVIQEKSFFNVTSIQESAIGVSQSGQSYENYTIEGQHLDSSQNPIGNGSTEWNTQFCSGTTSVQSNGDIQIEIPIEVPPGIYDLNISVFHPNYQPAIVCLYINVTPRSMQANITIHGKLNNYPINGTIHVFDALSLENLSYIDIDVQLSLNGTEFYIPVTTNEAGLAYWEFMIPSTLWGNGTIIAHVNSSTNYHDHTEFVSINIQFMPETSIQGSQIAFLETDYNISVCFRNPLGTPLEDIYVRLLDIQGNTIDQGTTNSLGQLNLSWFISANTRLGETVLTIQSESLAARFIHGLLRSLSVSIYNPVILNTDSVPWYVTRGNSSPVNITLASPIENVQVTLLINETNNLFSMGSLFSCNNQTRLNIDIQLQVDVGQYFALLTIAEEYTQIVSVNEVELIVLGKFNSNTSISSAFYDEQVAFDMSVTQDNGTELNQISIQVFDSTGITVLIPNQQVELSHTISLQLPSSLPPGSHDVILQLSYPNYKDELKTCNIFVWMRTTISITVNKGEDNPPTSASFPNQNGLIHAVCENESSISAGSIILPPPILVNEITSNESDTTLSTSLTSCPRFNSGTNNLSTPSENSLTAWSGNGQSVLSCIPLIAAPLLDSMIACSTERNVLPKHIIASFASVGPKYLGSGKPSAETTFFLKRLTKLL